MVPVIRSNEKAEVGMDPTGEIAFKVMMESQH
jgi:hypothetical protein